MPGKNLVGAMDKEEGFTLIEIIVVLIVASLVGSLLVEVMGTSMIKSGSSLIAVQTEFSLNEVMERMTADFKNLTAVDNTPLATFKSRVENGNSPSSTPYFGQYTVTTRYITFDVSNNENTAPSGDKVLKVTIANGGQTLVALFTK